MTVATVNSAQESFNWALHRVTENGFSLVPEASDELKELILGGFRKMQKSRILDLSTDNPRRVSAEEKARDNLDRLLTIWMEVEGERGTTELSVSGFRRAYASLCPCYPCSE